MKPKTKLQKEVYSLHTKLRPIPQKVYERSLRQLYYYCTVDKRNFKFTCCECNHTWLNKKGYKENKADYRCPKCHKVLKLHPTSYLPSEIIYVAYVTTYKNWQVTRILHVKKNSFKTRKPVLNQFEVAQLWINEKAKTVTLGGIKSAFFYYCHNWDMSQGLVVKPTNLYGNFANLIDYVYPIANVIPIIKRNGFKGKLYKFNPALLFKNLLTDNRFETLFKAGQIKALCKYAYEDDDTWRLLKICMRHNYIINDFSLWRDYIRLAARFHTDIHKPEILCPENLHEAHNKYVQLKAEKDKKDKLEKRREEEEIYKREKGKYFGLVFKSGKIEIAVLNSVKEVYNEGIALSHCVYTSQYHLKKDCLLMSARIGTKHIETIEFDLELLTIIQSRGHNNQFTKYHKKIISLVNENINLIKKRKNERKKQSTMP